MRKRRHKTMMKKKNRAGTQSKYGTDERAEEKSAEPCFSNIAVTAFCRLLIFVNHLPSIFGFSQFHRIGSNVSEQRKQCEKHMKICRFDDACARAHSNAGIHQSSSLSRTFLGVYSVCSSQHRLCSRALLVGDRWPLASCFSLSFPTNWHGVSCHSMAFSNIHYSSIVRASIDRFAPMKISKWSCNRAPDLRWYCFSVR